ncbi:hypothetical protein KDL01_29205 [Actinospica durhamensis]|uniref:Uncharacterized protein n=1 Tax=Actinospica durhamensis TaxID=1508375 RepID=A0A941EVW2_9ACTN|nr:hypothetical protein [Actinospica durhamensis]MBR7837393.1 hypothetical protein [Actinospica durhamensis]
MKPFEYLNPGRILNGQVLQSVDAPEGRTWKFPQSRRLRQVLRQPLAHVEIDDDRFQWAFDRFELLASIISMGAPPAPLGEERAISRHPWYGEFLSYGERRPGGDATGFAAEVESAWPVGISEAFGNDQDAARAGVASLREWISRTPLL